MDSASFLLQFQEPALSRAVPTLRNQGTATRTDSREESDQDKSSVVIMATKTTTANRETADQDISNNAYSNYSVFHKR